MTELTAVRTEDGGWAFDVVTASVETASAIPLRPPSWWFDEPGLTEPTALTVTADGRVYGHCCTWSVRHIGLPGHRTPPRSKTNYREFLRGQVETEDGSMVATGPLSLGGGHAGLDGDIVAAVEHYDDVTSAVADVRVGEDSIGLWMAGALRPNVTPETIRTLRASSVSGDWRAAQSNDLALCAILAVNTPGFNVPRASLAASGSTQALVACGVVMPEALTAANSDPDGTVYEDGSVKGGKKKSSGGGGSSGWDESKHPRDAIGQWAPKDEAGKQAQKDAGARANYGKLEGASDADADKMLRGMSDGDLRKLTAFAYSSKTSDPRIVKARIKVANEMGRRGIDIKKHGARGGGKKSATRASAVPVAAPETEVQVESVNEDDVDVAGLLAAGDGPPAPHDKPAADADDSDDKAGQVSFAEGDRVTIGDTGLSGHVQSVDDGQAHVSVTVKVEALTAAEDDEDEAVAAAADPNTSMLEGLTASVSALTDMVASMQAERRAEKAQSILDGLG